MSLIDPARRGPLTPDQQRQLRANYEASRRANGEDVAPSDDDGADAEKRAPRILCLADVKPQAVKWLWKGRLACGKIGLLSGDPGVCKSYLTVKIASDVSRGRALPGSDSSDGGGSPKRVLIVSYEDDSGDTIVPRAQAAGADMRNIDVLHLGTRGFSIPADLPELEKHIRERQYALVIIDPLGAALSGAIDAYKDSDVRQALAPLAQIAAETGAAILVIRHLPKRGSGRAITLGSGSIGITGAARVELLMAIDEQDPTVRIIAVVKCNLARMAQSLSFRLVPVIVPDVGEFATLEFLGIVPTSADDIASARVAADGESGQEQRMKIDEAADFLRELCASGPVDRREVERCGKANGHPMRTLDRARERAGIGTRAIGFGKEKRSEWFVRDDTPIPAKGSSDAADLTPDSAIPANRAKSPYIGGHGGNGAIGSVPRLLQSTNGTGPHEITEDL